MLLHSIIAKEDNNIHIIERERERERKKESIIL